MSKVMLVLASVLAALLTVGLLIAGFFIGITLLGVFVLVAGVFWLRRKLRGGAPPAVAGASREPVIIEGEFVVLPSRPRPENSD
jgi:UPF0716 family protein affecting phage T7 exclusion